MSGRWGAVLRFVAPSRSLRQRLAATVVAGVLVGGAVACGSEPVSAPGGNIGSVVRTFPGGGSSIAAVSLRTDLLRVDEMRAIVALGFDIREQPVLDPKQFVLTTLRGPCGATVPTPFRADGGFKVFRSTVTLVIESVAEPGPAASAAFVDALAADAVPGCPPFEEQVGNGPSKIETKTLLTLPPLGDQRVGWEQTVTASDARVGYRYIVAIRGGPRVLLLAILATNRIEPAALDEVATRAASG